MPINTDLNVSPYFDDYSETKDFYRVLFRPGVSVQARELNQLQSILQKQIERFGNNIYKKGTIIDGCHFSFDTYFPFVKIKDIQTNGLAVDVAAYIDKYVQNDTTGLNAHVITGVTGFETSDPNLNTLFVRYQNSGTAKNLTEFANGNVLRVRDSNTSIFSVSVTTGSSGFVNTNPVVFVSAIAVTNTLGGNYFSTAFVVGNTISQTIGSVTANAVITAVDYTTNTDVVILNIKPKDADLASGNSTIWTLTASANTSEQLTGTNGATGVIVDSIGSGATATMITDSSLGAVQTINMVTQGSGYYVAPFVSVSGAPVGSITALSLSPKNYLAEITVAENLTTPSTGNGYAFSVSEGVIYQKGYFSRVDAQRVIVERYHSLPDQKVVGFDTRESVVNSNIDATLLDNATGTYNYNAPGANRLNLTPYLVVLDKTDAIANDEFFSIVEWSEGQPFKQHRNTAFNAVERELAQRTFDESGNYVLDPFYLYTKSTDTFANEANSFNIVIDPGTAYISGYRVQTESNASKTVQKGITSGTDTIITTNTAISINYGNYIRVNEVGGAFLFSTGTTLSLRDLPKTYLTVGALDAPAANVSSVEIGQAKLRSIVYESGEPGTAAAIYRLYIFDIKMNAGKNFKNVKSIFFDNNFDAVADVVLQLDPSTQTYVAELQEKSNNSLLVYSGVDALKSVSSVTYTYRSANSSVTMNTLSGFTLSAGSGETWPYSGTLSTNEEEDIIIVPLANAYVVANSGGSVSVTATSQTVTGTSTTFISDYTVGDYILIANSGTSAGIKRITGIANNITLYLAANAGTTVTNANTKLAFPQYAPIPFSTRSGRTASVSGSTLTVSLGQTMNAAVTVAATYNMKTTSTVSKTAQRKRYVKIRPANNAANVSANATGTVSGNTTSAVLIGTGTALSTAFAANDYIAIWANSTFYNLRQVSSVANATYLTLTSNGAVANASATVAKVTSVNMTGPWPLGVPDIFRLRNVYIGNSSVNTSSTAVTDNFYIESNQSENSYDIGYLYKKPTSTYTVGLDNYLLVEFDRFTSSTIGGFKNINSYTIDDSKTLTELDTSAENSSINTLEIPEVFGIRGNAGSANAYYDLRDYLDFRPYANATVTVANAASYATNAPINPADVTFATKFDTSDKKFPAPESDVFATIENYLPRTDAVIITSNGDFNVVKGTHGDEPPDTPSNSILINYLNIPPYPSLPLVVSRELANFIDKNIANGKFLKKRVDTYTVKAPLSSTDISRQQPRGYTMEQIGKLERRIADLEYYASLSLVEDTVKNLTIPSYNDPTLNRFKFGYFVDNFSTTGFSDLDNPEFNATIFNYELSAKKDQLNLEFVFDSSDNTQQYVSGHYATLPYAEFPLVQQLNATTTTGTGNSANYTVEYKGQTANWHHSQNGYEYRHVKMANTAATATFYFDAQGHGLERWEIYQSVNPINARDYNSPSSLGLGTATITSESAVVLTTADRNWLESNKVNRINLDGKIRYGNWTSTSSRPNFSFQTSGGNTKYYVKDCGKITWTHDPTKGNHYYIAARKGSFFFTAFIYYPATAIQAVTTAPTPEVATSTSTGTVTGTSITTTTPTTYTGRFVEVIPSTFRVEISTNPLLDLYKSTIFAPNKSK